MCLYSLYTVTPLHTASMYASHLMIKSVLLYKDTAAGEGAVGLKQLGGDVNPLALHCLAVVSQR